MKMKNLRLLGFCGGRYGEAILYRMHVSVSDSLRYIWWDIFPLKSLQHNFDLANPANAIPKSFCEKLTATQNLFNTLETIYKWRAADMSIWDTDITRPAALSVDNIPKYVSSCNKDLVGIDSKIEEFELLCIGSMGLWISKKLLIALDGVAHPTQMVFVIGPLDNWLNRGRKFIVTRREKKMLQYLLHKGKIYKLYEWSDNGTLQSFNRHVFKQEDPQMEYKELSKMKAEYAKGVPWTPRVVGTSLRGKNKHKRESATRNPDRILCKDIKEVPKSSDDRLFGEVKLGLLSDEKIGYGVDECSNLLDLIKSDVALGYEKGKIPHPIGDLESGFMEVRFFFFQGFEFEWQSDEQSSSQEETPVVINIFMPDSSIEQHQEAEQTISHQNPNLLESSELLSHLETTRKDGTNRTGLLNWLRSMLSLSSWSPSSATEELEEAVKNQQQILQQHQRNLNSTQAKVAEIHKRLDEEVQRILDLTNRCGKIEDCFWNDPPPPPPSTGNGSTMAC